MYGSTTSFGNTNVFNKNRKKKKKLKEDLDFIAIKKNQSKNDEPHERMFGPKDHPLFKKPKVYHWCPYHLMSTVPKEEKCEKSKKIAKMDKA